jgi:hypothetical protein
LRIVLHNIPACNDILAEAQERPPTPALARRKTSAGHDSGTKERVEGKSDKI